MTLRPRQELFCQEYAVDRNGTQAAIRAGYSERSANQQSSDLMANPNIASRIDELTGKAIARAELRAEITVAEILVGIRDNIDNANNLKQTGPAMAGWKLLGQSQGMFKDQIEVNITERMSDDELEDSMVRGLQANPALWARIQHRMLGDIVQVSVNGKPVDGRGNDETQS